MRRNLAARAGQWSARHRKVAILGWLALVLASVAIGGAVGTNTLQPEDLGNGESGRADKALAAAGFGDQASEQVLVQGRDGALNFSAPAFRAAVADVTARLERFDTVENLKSPADPTSAGQVSADRRSAVVQFDVRGDYEASQDNVKPIVAAVEEVQRAHPSMRIEQFGDASASVALSDALGDDFRRAETLSLPITLIILVAAFGALVAAGLPLLLAISAVAITLGVLAPISQVVPVDEASSSVILLIGLAVGVDYSLFYLRRERDERRAGRSEEAALQAAAATSGRAVLVSGATVMIAMAGMYLTGNATFQSFATGTILVVGIAMVGSVTVLPAALSKLGDRVDKGRIPFLRRRDRDPESGVWAAIVGAVLRRPWTSAIIGTTLLVLLALPTLRLHTINSGVQGLPRDLPIMQTYERLQAAFPGGPMPAIVAVQADDVTAPGVVAGIEALRQRAVATGLMQEPVTVTPSADRTVAVVSVPMRGTGTDATSERALATLREEVIPQTIERVPAVESAPVSGLTAGSKDFNDLMKERAPWVFAFVLGLAFLLLMVTFRSVVVAAKAIVLNLLSVGAAYGALVLIFQDGRLESLLGYTSLGGITSWLPLFLFVILFGLSMDYHVFILSRVREAYDSGMPTEQAVAHAIKATAGVVTSAAVVMVGVFAVFATLSGIDFKQMGVGLALAVLIDATIVRAVLLPSYMKLLGDRNWYLPGWLQWLPHVAHEAAVPAVAGAPAAAMTTSTAPAEADPLHIVVERRGDAVALKLRGELDLLTAPTLRRRLLEAEEDADTVVVDLRAVTFIDSAGIGELVGAHRRARRRGARFVAVRTPQTPVAQILTMTRLDRTFETTAEPPALN